MIKKYFILLILFLALPNVNAQSLIDINIDKLFLVDEDVTFVVSLNNPNSEIFEGRLFVELISQDGNIKLAKETFFIYPKDANIKTFNERLKIGNYKLRAEIKDRYFEKTIDQKVVEFNVVGSCSEQICLLEEADRKCDCSSTNPFEEFNSFLLWVLAVMGIAFIFLVYNQIRGRWF